MSGLALILVVAAVGYGLARWLRLPVIPLLLFAGLGLAVSGWLPRQDFTEDAFILGLAFLVFSAGMELNPERFGKQIKAVLWVGLAQFILVGGFGLAVAWFLGFEGVDAVYLGIALSTSSTLVVVSHLKQQQQMFEPFARLVIGVLLVQDLLMILIIVVLARWSAGGWAIAMNLGGVLALAGLAGGFQRWLVPALLIRRQLDEETLLLVVLALLFTFVELAWQLHIPPVAAAFLAGFALANFPANGVVRGLLLSLNDFFLAIFFTTLGSLILLPDPWLILKTVVLAGMVLLVTPPLVAWLAEWQGLTSRPALESGLLLAQTSEFALVLGLAGSQMAAHISREAFSVIGMVAVVTMTLTPFVATDRFTTFLLPFYRPRRLLQGEESRQDHVLMLGFGAGGMWVIKPLRQQGHDVLIVDDDPAVIAQLQKMNIPCIRGDGADEKVLDRVGARRAKLILASMRRVEEAVRVLQVRTRRAGCRASFRGSGSRPGAPTWWHPGAQFHRGR